MGPRSSPKFRSESKGKEGRGGTEETFKGPRYYFSRIVEYCIWHRKETIQINFNYTCNPVTKSVSINRGKQWGDPCDGALLSWFRHGGEVQAQRKTNNKRAKGVDESKEPGAEILAAR